MAESIADRFNREYFRLFTELLLLLRLRFSGRSGGSVMTARRILIVNNGLIGEFLVTLPALRHLLDATDATVDLIVSPPVAPLARNLVGISRVFPMRSVYRRDTERELQDAQQVGDYDCVVVMQVSKDAYRALKAVRCRRFIVPLAIYLNYTVYVFRTIGSSAPIKQVEDVAFEVFGVKKSRHVEFDDLFAFRPDEVESAARFPWLQDRTTKNIVVHTGSGWSVKLWKNDRWVELLTALHARHACRFIFVGGTDREEVDFNAIQGSLSFEVHSVVKSVNLCELALLMRQCDFFLGVDSGPRHIAHLLRLPSVCLLGPGPRTYIPTAGNAVFLDRSDCHCSSFYCRGHGQCMDRIRVSDVMDEFECLLRDTMQSLAVT